MNLTQIKKRLGVTKALTLRTKSDFVELLNRWKALIIEAVKSDDKAQQVELNSCKAWILNYRKRHNLSVCGCGRRKYPTTPLCPECRLITNGRTRGAPPRKPYNRILPLLLIVAGCKTPTVANNATVAPPVAIKATPKVLPPSPPGMSQMLDTLKPSAVVVPPPTSFTMTVAWDAYTNDVASNLFIQGSDDGLVWTNEAQVAPVWLTNSWKLTESSARHYYRLMVQ